MQDIRKLHRHDLLTVVLVVLLEIGDIYQQVIKKIDITSFIIAIRLASQISKKTRIQTKVRILNPHGDCADNTN